MTGLDHVQLLERSDDASVSRREFSLKLGDFVLPRISYATIRDLAGHRGSIGHIVADAFVGRPVLWAEPNAEEAEGWRDELELLEHRLARALVPLDLSEQPSDKVFADTLRRWLDLTRSGRETLQESLGETCSEERLADILGQYRRDCYPPISALIQWLPEDDVNARRGHEALCEGKRTLTRCCGIAADEILDAQWLPGEVVAEEETFVTWGIP